MTRVPGWRLLACGLFASAAVPSMIHAAGPQHDVFERPKPRALKQHDAESVKTQRPLAPIEWNPELRAIIHAGANAWVNVEGRILQVGQDMDGFRLVAVEERRAVFVKDEARYTLDLRDIKARPVGSKGIKTVTEAASGEAGKAVADSASGSSKAGTGPAHAGSGKVATDPVPVGSNKRTDEVPVGSGNVANDRLPLGGIKTSVIVPGPDVSPSLSPPTGSRKLAEASGR
jgi:hypothetical protein